MPAATPFPRSPSVLVLGSAERLLSGPGCAVCRYTAEASDRYLAWFALEAHADPVTITRLCGSLGMCPRHTRALMSQPGAAIRLTSVYSYVLQAARAQLGPRPGQLAPCPACEHGEAAADRAVAIVLDELTETTERQRLPGLAELCFPHLRAAGGRARRRAAGRLRLVLASRAADGRLSLEAIAGGTDHDADTRAGLHAALSPSGNVPPGTCPICLAVARAERSPLAHAVAAGGGGQPGVDSHRGCLCAVHLRDAAVMYPGCAPALLARQCELQADAVSGLVPRRPRWPGPGAGRGRRKREGRGPLPDPDACSVCRVRESAAQQELERCQTVLRAQLPGHDGEHRLCVRHVLSLRAADPAAGRVASGPAAGRADILIEELAEASRKNTWGHRHEARGPEMAAWRRAAAFLDGGVFGGCPPEDR